MTVVVRTLIVGALVAGCAGTATPRVASSPHPSPSLLKPQAVLHTDHGPAGLLIGRHTVFVANHRGGTVQRVDPQTNRVTGTVEVGGQLQLEESTGVGGLTEIDEATTDLWTCSNADGNLRQVDPRSMRVTATLDAKCDGGSRTRVGDAVWAVPGPDTVRVVVVDTMTAKVRRRIAVPAASRAGGLGPALLVHGRVLIGAARTPVFTPAGQLVTTLPVSTPWLMVTGGKLYSLPSNGKLNELDPTTLTVRRTLQLPEHGDADPQLVAAPDGTLYYRPTSNQVYRVDPVRGTVVPFATLPYAEAVTVMAVAFGSLWVTNFDNDTVFRFPLSTT